MMYRSKLILFFLALFVFAYAEAQDCDFDFDLGSDVVLTCGQTYTIQASPGFDNYLWSTGSTAESISVSQTGTYSCTISSSLGNIISNGDFSGGDYDFSTDYIYGTGGSFGLLSSEGQYAVTSNSSLVHNNFANCFDHTTGDASGSMMVANGSNTTGTIVWEQTVPVSPNTDYVFSAWFMSVVSGSPAEFSLVINGVNVGNSFQANSTVCNWQNFFANYNSGTNTSLTITILNNNTNGSGNDFAIDDISLSPSCTYTDEIVVTGASMPVLTLTNDTTICEGQTITLEASSDIPGSTFTWAPGFTSDPTLTITPTGSVQYTVVTTSPEGCNSPQQTINVTVANPDDYDLNVPAAYAACAGELVNLTFPTATSGTYMWTPTDDLDDATAANPNAGVDETTTFTVVYTDVCGITQTATTVVNILGGELDLGDDFAICDGQDNQIVLPAGPIYTWQDGTIGNIYTVTETGLYTVTAVQGDCESSGSVFATVSPSPEIPDITDKIICEGESYTVNFSAYDYSFTWNDGNTSPVRELTESGIYTIEASNGTCTDETTFTLNVLPLPVVDLGGIVAICAGNETQLSVDVPNSQVQWSTGETTSQISVSQGGAYSVTVTLNGCSVTDNVLVLEGELPQIAIDGANTICSGQTAELSATANSDYSYEWNNGETTSSITISEAGNYSVTATNIVTGCESVREINVTTLESTRLDVPDTLTICEGKSRRLIADVNTGDTVVWNDVVIGKNFTISNPGVYTVTAYGPCGAVVKEIEVYQEDCSSSLYIPSGFTPNGDGVNDIFKAYGYNIETFKIWVFDRWGKVVFHSDNIEFGWNGGDQSGEYFVPSGIYPYKVVVQYNKSSDAEEVRGSVTVVR